MIIKWTGDGIKVIPCLGGLKGRDGVTLSIVDKVVLQPGHNEVDEKIWESARVHVLNELSTDPEAKNSLIEIGVEVKEETIDVEQPKLHPDTKEPMVNPETKEVIMEKVKEKKTTIMAKKFSKLSIEQAQKVIKDTFNMDSLEKWLKREHRESVRVDIQNQIEYIKNAHEDRRKKEQEKNK